MILVDVNVLVYAFRQESPEGDRYAAWLGRLMSGEEAFGMADLVLSGFLRIVTHPGIFKAPASTDQALAFVEQIRGRPQCVTIAPGPRHWEIFTRLCRTAGVRGNLVPDAYLAALAIESGSGSFCISIQIGFLGSTAFFIRSSRLFISIWCHFSIALRFKMVFNGRTLMPGSPAVFVPASRLFSVDGSNSSIGTLPESSRIRSTAAFRASSFSMLIMTRLAEVGL